MEAVIRTASRADIAFLSEHDRHIPLAELDEVIRRGRVLLLEVEGEPAGWLRWGMFWDNTPFMNMLYLLEGYRSLGYGRMLVRHWEQQMQTSGHQAVMTSTQANEYAQHFYRRLGYHDIGSFALPGDGLELMLSKSL